MSQKRQRSWTLGIAVAICLAGVSSGQAEDANDLAAKLLQQSGVQGGIILHLGCDDGTLTAALHVSDRFTVQGLDRDADDVEKARALVTAKGLYGPVAIEQLSDGKLPYADNLLNLVIVQDKGLVPNSEVMRVLAPHGVACFQEEGQWSTRLKPRPDTIDEWSHYLHDATNNAVARDTVVGPARSVQWIAPPLWLRSHETPSGIEAPVSAGGRLFYIFDEGLIGITDPRLPDRWTIVCRDAFNGKLLWKRPLGAWGWRQWNRKKYTGVDWTTLRAARVDVPADNNRRLVADAKHLYATLAFDAPLSILDAATGEVLTTIADTENTREILTSDGVVVAYAGQETAGTASRRGKQSESTSDLVAVDTSTHGVVWRRKVRPIPQLNWAIDTGRVIYVSGKQLTALDLKTGNEIWSITRENSNPKTLVCVDGVVVLLGANYVATYDAADGKPMWNKKVRPIGGPEGLDLFVVNGAVWRGMMMVDDAGQPARKSPNVLDIGWDLRSGKETKRVFAKNLRSPEHHHRCYRNVATSRFLISSYEGAEFLDLVGNDNVQNNWIRGACRTGMMPSNGLLYVPPDQCFCNPASKLLGYTALSAHGVDPLPDTDAASRLVKGPAYTAVPAATTDANSDWPTLRHDAARHGSTPVAVDGPLQNCWQVSLGGRLSAPVAAEGRLYVAQIDAHTVCALNQQDGTILWRFIAGGRVDSPPTIYGGRVLFGSRDGYVYCLRASDGALAWRFRAAPVDRRIAVFDQLESTWPVFGSVLVDHGLAYFTAGRSTYLDGGIRVFALNPETGAAVHQCTLKGPFTKVPETRDLGFFSPGALADVLVAEGGFIYMRQRKLTPDLHEVTVPVLSSKGAQDVGMHVFSTASLLDGSWYNRTFWMYCKRWPGFQLANQAPKTGQLLVVDDNNTYAVRVFYRRNVHSPMFFPGKEGYLLFADANTTEPQIVGEQGARPPLQWLPQSDYSRGRGDEMRVLDSPAFGLDKMIGYTRADPALWMRWINVRMRAMVKAGDQLFVAGPPDTLDPNDPFAAFEGRNGARLIGLSAVDGQQQPPLDLDGPPVFDGMIAANHRLFISLENGKVVCLGKQGEHR